MCQLVLVLVLSLCCASHAALWFRLVILFLCMRLVCRQQHVLLIYIVVTTLYQGLRLALDAAAIGALRQCFFRHPGPTW